MQAPQEHIQEQSKQIDIVIEDDIDEFVAKVILLVSSFIIFGLLLLSLTAIGAFVRFYNYELYNEPKKLKRFSGLFERQQISVRKQKIQGISIKQNIFAKLLNRVTVVFHQTEAESGLQAKKQSFMIPMLKPDAWQQYVPWVYPDINLATLKYNKVHHQYFIRYSFYAVILPISLLAILFATVGPIMNLILLGLIPFGIFIVWLRYRRYGYYYDDQYAIFRSGFIGVRYTVVPLYKVQHSTIIQSTSQRKRALATCQLQLPFMKMRLPFIQLEEASKLINLTLYRIESSKKNWL